MKKFGKKGIVAVASLIAALSVSAIVPAVANAGGDTTTLPKGFESESVEIKGSNEALSKWMFFFNGDKDAEGKVRRPCFFRTVIGSISSSMPIT